MRYRKRNWGVEHGGHLPVSFCHPFLLFLWLDMLRLFFDSFFSFSMDMINSKARLCIASDPGDEI